MGAKKRIRFAQQVGAPGKAGRQEEGQVVTGEYERNRVLTGGDNGTAL